MGQKQQSFRRADLPRCPFATLNNLEEPLSAAGPKKLILGAGAITTPAEDRFGPARWFDRLGLAQPPPKLLRQSLRRGAPPVSFAGKLGAPTKTAFCLLHNVHPPEMSSGAVGPIGSLLNPVTGVFFSSNRAVCPRGGLSA